MNRERYAAAKPLFSTCAGAAAALSVTAGRSGSPVAVREAVALCHALAALERLVDESRDEAARGEGARP